MTQLHVEPIESTFSGRPPMSPPQPPRTSYDELPYPSFPYPQTHPDHLAAVATLLGLSPARADRCRVLELGCAGGGNLIPLASTYPDSTFLGIDLSGEQVRQGEELREALALRNIELRTMSILDVDDSFGVFDFIICHGVYSWVPEPVQDKILAICARHLASQGIGFVSYNTYPGWHMRGMIRAMMGFHDQRFRGCPPLERVAEARALLAFLAEAVPRENTPYSSLLREHLELLNRCQDPYLFHEHLEECNEPIYFMDFCGRLAAHGLRYVGESEFRVMVASTSFPLEVQRRLHEVAPSFLEMEQYMDFLRNRMFRQTLICHARHGPSYEVKAERLAVFHVDSPLRPTTPVSDVSSDSTEEFATEGGPHLTTPTPIVKAALLELGAIWPQAISLDALLSRARARLEKSIQSDPAADAQALGKALLTAYASAGRRLVELWLCPPNFVTEVSRRPCASRLARHQVLSTHHVTNLRHEVVNLSVVDGRLLRLLDGTREPPDLLEALVDDAQKGELNISEADQPVIDVDRTRGILAQVMEERLPRIAKAALLIA
jgi:methyltransferase-like protein/2-polyprenyl-3-methyl-5-hydroxy-6-metoxy-1,4-benzoquinol methylase